METKSIQFQDKEQTRISLIRLTVLGVFYFAVNYQQAISFCNFEHQEKSYNEARSTTGSIIKPLLQLC